MKNRFRNRKRIILGIIAFFIVLLTVAITTMRWYQDYVVQKLVAGLNENFDGALVIEDTDISPFAEFPYISVIIKNVQVFEDKEDMFAPILDVQDIALGVHFWSLLSGDFKVNMLKVSNGNFDIYRYSDGTFNLVKALSGKAKIQEIKEDYNIELKKIELENLDIIKYDEESNMHVETYIVHASSRFKTSKDDLMIGLKSELVMNVIDNGDSTIFKKKRFETETELSYNRQTGELLIHPTVISMHNASFNIEGKIEVLNEFDVDLVIHGRNPNFNLLIALAPEELIPTLEQYENAGNIHFDFTVKGPTLSGQQPAINAVFGCDNAYFKNPISQKQVGEISFSGHFSNGEARDFSTMEFSLENFQAKPEAGVFNANLLVKNFETPEIDLTVDSEFNLDFLAKFLNITRIENLTGDVSLQMNFRDIIDLQNPERSIREFNKSYFSELNVEDLSFTFPGYHLTFDSIDLKASMDGNHANIDYFFINIGRSDITVKGEIDNLPAIIYQTADSVKANLFIFSSLFNLHELTSGDTLTKRPMDEQIENLRLELAFLTTPKCLFQFKNLPTGDFFINNFYGKLSHYPHTFKKFDAHVLVKEESLEIKSFKGQIDKSPFEIQGIIDRYPLLLAEHPEGSVEIDYKMSSEYIRLYDLFTYNGENYVPPDYRKEEIQGLKIYGNAEFTFADSLVKSVWFFDQLNATLKLNKMDIRDIHGKISLSDEFFVLDAITGNIGNSDFYSNMVLYLGENDSIRKSLNRMNFESDFVDFDQLSNYAEKYQDSEFQRTDPDSIFNIYTLPFTDLTFALDIGKMHYHKHLLQNINADLRIQKDHFLYVDTLNFEISGGDMFISGYFNGTNPDDIYFYPSIKANNINLEDVLYRFDNFGQQYIVSQNLSGLFSGNIHGNIHMHADMMPQVEGSEIFLDFQIINGSLKNYKPMESLSDYFRNKNLAHIRFDTLSNYLEIRNGAIHIPNMTINSSLGYIDISGTQSLDSHMEYYFKVPMKLVTNAAWQKLFGNKKNVADSTHIDAIQYKNQDRKYWYVNIKMEGTPDNYNITLGKKQKEKV